MTAFGLLGPPCLLFQEAFLSVSNAEDFTVCLWQKQLLTGPHKAEDVSRGIELRGHEGPVSCCGFSSDGGSLATGGRDQVSTLGPRALWLLGFFL